MKKIIALTLAIILCMLSIPAHANEVSVSPYYIRIRLMTHEFHINEQTGRAVVGADMDIKSGSYCTISAKIQRETDSGWVTVTTYRAVGGTSALIEETPTLTSGYNYKCTFTFTVYDEYDMIIEQKAFSEEADYT